LYRLAGRFARTALGLAFVGAVLLANWVRSLPVAARWLLLLAVLALAAAVIERRCRRRDARRYPPLPTTRPVEVGYLYTWWAPDGSAYVGSTNDLERRTDEHARGRLPFGPGWRAEVEVLPSREAAYDVEQARYDQLVARGVPVLNAVRPTGRR
jgi:hypothetical protein